MTAGLALSGLGVRHAGETLLRDISLDIRPGESLCLVGTSGGGKSLIACCVAGLLPACMAASGEVRLGGIRLAAADQAGLRALWDRHICLLPQEPAAALAPLMRAGAQTRLGPPALSRGAAVEFLGRFGLDRLAARRLPAHLSGGMAQRLLSALVARGRAGLLIVDEPTKGLDAARRDDVVALLLALRDAGRAVLVITHDLDVVRALGGTLAVLEHGSIVESGPAAALLAAPGSAFLRACLAAEPRHWPVRRRPGLGATVAGAEALVIARDRRRLAGPLALDLKQGQVTALLGASGTGKTTLGDTLLGLEPAAAGRIRWFGRTLDRHIRRRLRPRFQKLHQDPTTVFPATSSFGDAIADLRRLTGDPGAVARAHALLERMRVPGALLHRRPGAVSGGEAQRLALARLMALQPALLVADEPSSRLDLPLQAELLLMLRGFADQTELSVLLITHSHDAADAMADQRLAL